MEDLSLGFHDLDESDLDHEFDTGTLNAPARMKLRDIVDLCRRVYADDIGVEYVHIQDTVKRRWLTQRLEHNAGRYELNADDKLRILKLLTAAEGLEKFLHLSLIHI